MPDGICKICNKFGKLTYEHVPPRATFNKHTRFKKVSLLDYFITQNPLETKFKGKIKQGGVGYYSLCRSCNNFLGATYIKDYQEYTNTFIEFAKKEDMNFFDFIMHDFNALNVLKQIVAMFFSINSVEFSERNRDLAEFVLNPKSSNFPKRFRVFNYLNTEGLLRNLPIMIRGSLYRKDMIKATELTFPPLGHVMTIDFNRQLPYHQEITSFKEVEFNQTTTFNFKICKLPTYRPILLDYRERTT